MPHLPRELTFARTPLLLLEVPAIALGAFPEAALDAFRPRVSRMITGTLLGPLLGVLVAALFAWPSVEAWSAEAGLPLTGTPGVVAVIAVGVVVLIMNYMYGDWPIFAGAAVTAPLAILAWSQAAPRSVIAASALALATIGAVRAHQARGERYRRLGPIFASRRRLDGTVVAVTYEASDSDKYTPILTVVAGERRLTAGYADTSNYCPALGHPVSVWVCDDAPDVVVVCIGRALPTPDGPVAHREQRSR